MSLSRRAFVRRLGRGSVGLASASFIIGRGYEELTALGYEGHALDAAIQAAAAVDAIKLSSNENLRGPSPKVLEVLKGHPSVQLGLGYPPPSRQKFIETIANMYDTQVENVTTATGSGAILTAGVRAYVTTERPLVTGSPSYGSPVSTAERMGAPVKAIPVNAGLWLDLDGMVQAANGAGLVFLCNPNNPTSTVHTQADVESAVREIKRRSPETAILIDEAYIDYSTSPGVGTAARLALELPNVFVTRTFSKAYGMAGMRMGYAIGQPDTVRTLRTAWGLGDINELQAVAGIAALEDKEHMDWERQENRRVREWTLNQFKEMGYDAPDSQTNFVFVNIGRPASEFRDGCRAEGVNVGRDFPPMEKTHARISLGRMEDMEKAMVVFKRVLGHATAM